MAHHIPAEEDIQAGRKVLPGQVRGSRILRTAAGVAGRILVAGEVGHNPAVVVAVGRSLAVRHILLVVVGSRPAADRMKVVGHSHRRHSLLEEEGEPVTFRLLCHKRSRLRQA